ncbi:hypothetical protein PWG14_12330, partial (plasmid) [Chromobacterium amazonense]|uniref:PUA domain-containing protein n=1 Tax=Chromobacterium amazonense TaxID=1382803 RepID=UPI002A55562A|nr:hypothetical protein [Chromobacterium amazonense]
ITKILAAKRAARSGAATVIACGREPHVLSRLADGEAIGTQLVAATNRMAARKQWLADHLKLAGRLLLDDGAARAIRERGTSLLPVGVSAVEGDFLRGEAVACVDAEGNEVARGLVNYSSDEARQIMRKGTREIEAWRAAWSTTVRTRRARSCARAPARSKPPSATSSSRN